MYMLPAPPVGMRAKLPSALISTPPGISNSAFVPTPSVLPAVPLPTRVVTTLDVPEARTTFLMLFVPISIVSKYVSSGLIDRPNGTLKVATAPLPSALPCVFDMPATVVTAPAQQKEGTSQSGGPSVWLAVKDVAETLRVRAAL